MNPLGTSPPLYQPVQQEALKVKHYPFTLTGSLQEKKPEPLQLSYSWSFSLSFSFAFFNFISLVRISAAFFLTRVSIRAANYDRCIIKSHLVDFGQHMSCGAPSKVGGGKAQTRASPPPPPAVDTASSFRRRRATTLAAAEKNLPMTHGGHWEDDVSFFTSVPFDRADDVACYMSNRVKLPLILSSTRRRRRRHRPRHAPPVLRPRPLHVPDARPADARRAARQL